MAKINILPQSVYNRIAAGEVIERPASVVKELIENSLDAGATEISIYVENGGKQLIRVVDNGSGIERDDLQSAFMPHATSKISKAEDLETIITLGFRGEAVASISAVSKMTIISKTADKKCYSLTSDGGKLGLITEYNGEDVGTDIRVEGLFYNTPVRFKFLKTDRAEETEITTVVSRFILGNPKVSFSYYLNGKEALRSYGGGEDEAIAGVYGASILENCFKIDAEKHGIHVRGYIGNQNFSKSNKSYQFAFLNGRYISNATISAALSSAYASYLMKRQYPFYVLYITLAPEVVDVNVHPNKSDVRFADNGLIYGCIYSIITSVLDGKSSALEYVIPTGEKETKAKTLSESILECQEKEEKPQQAPQTDIFSSFSAFKGDEIADEQNGSALGVATLSYEEAQKEIREAAPMFRWGDDQSWRTTEEDFLRGFTPASKLKRFTGKLRGNAPIDKPQLRSAKGVDLDSQKYPELRLELASSGKDEGAKVDYFAENKKFLAEQEEIAKQNRINVINCTFAGKLFNTYLLYEHEDEIYVIDQHAAHERLIYDKFKEQLKNRTLVKQPMLIPFNMRLNSFEAEFIRERMDDIKEMGFDIEVGEDCVIVVSAIPLDLQGINLSKFFNAILGEVSGYRAIKLEELLKDKLASAACKAAVKGGMDLTQDEVNALLKLMDGDMGLKCPHGRPVVVKITRKQLEKMFKRIV